MRLLDAGVDHFYQDICVVRELDHQLLVLLHRSEAVLVDDVRVVEEQVILRGQFDLDVLKIVRVALIIHIENVRVRHCQGGLAGGYLPS